jgi:hypothetical protein
VEFEDSGICEKKLIKMDYTVVLPKGISVSVLARVEFVWYEGDDEYVAERVWIEDILKNQGEVDEESLMNTPALNAVKDALAEHLGVELEDIEVY